MFGTTLILAYSIMLLYVSWRAASVPLLDRHVSRKCFVGAGFVLWRIGQRTEIAATSDK